MSGALDALFRPRSVAIVGDTPRDGRGGLLHAQLVRNGFAGPIYPVNPKHAEIRGLKSYPSLAAIPDPIDFVAVALGPDKSIAVMEQAVAKHVGGILFIASGFAEAGPQGAAIQAELSRLATAHGMAMCGPNCYGIANILGGFTPYFGALPEPAQAGPVALVFQSGALTHAVADVAAARGMGFGYIVTAGNEATTEVADYVAAIASDPRIRVIACYVEGFKHPERLVAAAELVRKNGKHLVILKPGRSDAGRRATVAHTGTVAGEDRVYDALFRRLGIIRVDDLDELIESVEFLVHIDRVGEGTVAVATISGGGCGIIADVARDVGLELGEFTLELAEDLAEILPGFSTVNNPLDLTGLAADDSTIVSRAFEVWGQTSEIALTAFAINTPLASPGERALYRRLVDAVTVGAASRRQPTLLFTLSSGAQDPDIVQSAHRAGVPIMQGVRETLAALARVKDVSCPRPRPFSQTPAPPDGLMRLVRNTRGEVITESRAKEVLELAGIPTARGGIARTPDEAVRIASTVGFPVALKVESPDLPHRSDAGALRLNVPDADAARSAYAAVVEDAMKFRADAEITGVRVEAMYGDGFEVFIGVRLDPAIGPAIAFGLGGVLVEAFDDVAVRLAPITPAEAEAMISETHAGRLMHGFHGQSAIDHAALVDVLTRVSWLGWWLRNDLAEIDLNPTLVHRDGSGVRVLDALMVRNPLGGGANVRTRVD